MNKKVYLLMLASSMLVSCSPAKVYTPKAHNLNSKYLEKANGPQQALHIFEINKQTGLKSYINKIIENNKDIKSLALTVESFKLNEKIVNAASKPTINANVSGQRARDAEKKTSNEVSLGFDIKWALDVWGKLADESKASELQTQEQELVYENSKRALIAQAIKVYVDLATAQKQQQNMQKQLEISKSLNAIAEEEYIDGQIFYADLAQSRINLTHAEESLAQVQASKKVLEHKYNILKASKPTAKVIDLEITNNVNIKSLPTQIKATNLANRPDLLAEFKKIEILDYQTKAAYKALLPQINISATSTKSASNLANALSGNILWSLVGGISQPVFNSGELRALAKQKSKETEIAFYKYEQLVLNALEETENALVENIKLTKNLQLATKRKTETAKIFNAIEDSYKNGTAGIKLFLNSKKDLLTADNQQIQYNAEFLNNRVNLALAIGQKLN